MLKYRMKVKRNMGNRKIIIKCNHGPKNLGEIRHWDLSHENPNRTYRYVYSQYYALEEEAQKLLKGKIETLSVIYLFELPDLPLKTRFVENKNNCGSMSNLIAMLCEEIKSNELRCN